MVDPAFCHARHLAVIVASILGLGCAARLELSPEPGEVGTAAAFDWNHTDYAADGSWVILSQSDDVDGPTVSAPGSPDGPPTFDLKLILGTDPGVTIGDYEASPDDRFVVVERGDMTQVVEPATRRWTELVPSGLTGYHERFDYGEVPELPERAEPYWGLPACYWSFDAKSNAVSFLEPGPDGVRVAVQRLPEGPRHVIDTGPGALTWVEMMPAGDAVAVVMVMRDEGPTIESVSWPYHLGEEVSHCSDPGKVPEGARVVTRVFGFDGTERDRRPGEWKPLGAGLVRPTEEGLSWWRPGESTDVTTGCPGRLMFIDRTKPRALWLCNGEGAGPYDFDVPRVLRLDLFGEHRDLGEFIVESSVPVTGNDERYVAVPTDDGALLVDLDTGQVTPFPKNNYVIGIASGRAVVRRGQLRGPRRRLQTWIVDLPSMERLDSAKVYTIPWQLALRGSGSFLTFEDWLFDGAAGRIDRLPRNPVMVTDDRRALVLDSVTKRERWTLPRGPHRWYRIESPAD